MTYIFIMFIWVNNAAVPTWAYFDSEACWADAKIMRAENYRVECRTATLASPIMGLAPATPLRPRARRGYPGTPGITTSRTVSRSVPIATIQAVPFAPTAVRVHVPDGEA